MPPPLCSPAYVLDKFIVDNAASYASTAPLLPVQPDSLKILFNWHYFVGSLSHESRYRENILQRKPDRVQGMLDAMQDLLDASWVEERFKVILRVVLLRLAQKHLLYPRRLTLDNVFSEWEQLPPRITIGEVIRGSFNGAVIQDVAAGMSHLHENGIVHGRIHCYNILLTDTNPPHACLTDFGLTHVMGANTSLQYKYSIHNLTEARMRHLVAPEDNTLTNLFPQSEASDVYAFSTAAYQILTGHLPLAFMRIAERMQQLMNDCWHLEAKKRPDAHQVAQRLKDITEADRTLTLKGHVQAALAAILNNVEHHRLLISSDRLSIQRILDAFQVLLDTREFQQCRTQLIAAMRRISENSDLYPTHFSLNISITKSMDASPPITAGSFSDIYKVLFQGKFLCLKMIRMPQYDHLTKVFAREVTIWAQLSHPNVLPFLGLVKHRDRLCFVSFWAINGDLESYLQHNPSINRLLLCSDTAAGVEYLHQNNVVHDISFFIQKNVLIDASGRAALGDFGLSSVTDPQILQWTSQSTVESKGGTTRWQAPEILAVDTGIAHNTRESDVFAWACVCYEIFTGHVPYFESLKELGVMTKILDGVTPTRPNDSDAAWTVYGLNTNIWDLMQNCWKYQPSERLNMTEVILRLDMTKPVDTRPPIEWKGDSSTYFRNVQSENLSLSFWVQLDKLLSHIILSGSS
ncbi:hypothetical protein H0H92_001932 [Tricholoma furcatifolium]|nr:hypothetical protein H0H92_001932 [Tricholoma furcatifolium]